MIITIQNTMGRIMLFLYYVYDLQFWSVVIGVVLVEMLQLR